MESAPKGAIFIWCNGRKDYPERLARSIGRGDLQIVSPNWLESDRWKGMHLNGIVIDHAAELSGMQRDLYELALTRVRPNVK
jgi:hypothetical protein